MENQPEQTVEYMEGGISALVGEGQGHFSSVFNYTFLCKWSFCTNGALDIWEQKDIVSPAQEVSTIIH